MSFAAIFLLLIAASDAFHFVVDTPSIGSIWVPGGVMDIRWHLDNVSLPYHDLRVQLDLYFNGADKPQYYRSIATGIENNGLFYWLVPSDLSNSENGFRVVIQATDETDLHPPGSSGKFLFREIKSPSQVGLVVQNPERSRTLYANQLIELQWIKSGAMPDLPYGVNIELRSIATSESVLSIAKNATFGLDDVGHLSWTVPDNLPLSENSLQFPGNIFMWGYDSRREDIVYGESGDLIFDYTDTIPLTIRFVSPKQDATWVLGTTVYMTISLTDRDNPNYNTRRNVRLELTLIDDEDLTVLTIFEDKFIPESEWTGGTTLLSWQVPDEITLPSPPPDSGRRSRPIQMRKFYLRYHARYKPVQPDAPDVDIEGHSDTFFLRQIERKNELPGSSSSLRVTFWYILPLLFLFK